MPVTIRPATCLPVLGVLFFFGVLGLIPTLLVVGALGSALRDVIPPEPLLILAILTSFVLWPLFSIAALYGVCKLFGGADTGPQAFQKFQNRPALTDEEFARLVPHAREVALGVRAELEQLAGAEVARQLLPSDLVKETCSCAGVYPDEIDWVEFLMSLEARFEVRIPDEALDDATVADLIRWCAGEPKPA